ncbi:MAG: patatin-like phospholipase family protein [Bacteroidales bacterium]
MNNKKVSLVLASGGARGLAHIGVIDELVNRKFTIHSIAGSSMGAIVGGMYAAGTLEDYKKWVLKLKKFDVLSLMDFTLGANGIMKGEKIFNEMKREGFIPDIKIENLEVPLAIVASDIVNNKEIVFRKGSLYNALRASISIPNVFTPVEVDDGLLVDGGVLNPLPLNLVDRDNGDLLVAVDINALIPYSSGREKDKTEKEGDNDNKSTFEQLKARWFELFEGDEKKKLSKANKLGYMDMFTRTYQVMQNKITQCSLENIPPDVLVKISKDACGTFEFYRAKEMIELGRETCAKALDKASL